MTDPKKPEWFNLKVNKANSHADIYIQGVIGWDATPEALIQQLQSHDNLKTIDVYLNTTGGKIGDGLAIMNMLRMHPASVSVTVTGYALSMGSMITQAASAGKRRMASNTLMMIHRAQGGAIGDAADLARESDVLKKHEQVLIGELSRVMSLPEDEVMALMTDETWYTAEEALAAGLIDEVIEPVDIDDAENKISKNHWQAIASADFKHAPENFKQRLQIHLPQNKGLPMTDKNRSTPGNPHHADPDPVPAAPTGFDAKAIAREAVAAENKRQTEIRSAFSASNAYLGDDASALLEQCLSDIDCDKARTNQIILDAIGKAAPPPIGSHATVTTDEKENFRKGVTLALTEKAGTISADDKAKNSNNNFRSYTLLELARHSLHLNGVTTGAMSKREIVGNAFTHSSGDFSSLLANVAEKSMLKGHAEADETFQIWTARGEASDFKPLSRVDLNAYPSLPKIPEGSEYTYGTVGDRGEIVQLATYGSLFGITRQAIINDDLSAFTRIPQRQGRAAIRTIGDLVYAVLTSNPAMSDNDALFHATHKNLLAAAGINTASVDAMRVAMAIQKGAGKNAPTLNINLAHLLVPKALEGTANVVANSEFEIGASNKNNTTPNSVRGTFSVIADARLDANSSTAWYGAANSGMHDTIEVTYLDGNDTPYLETQDGWTVDGVEMKVRIDAAVSPLDFRTLAKNPGQ